MERRSRRPWESFDRHAVDFLNVSAYLSLTDARDVEEELPGGLLAIQGISISVHDPALGESGVP